ncbi:hypothetical protein [Alishewanella sp. SMS8]|uniref:hypothetical protein n=1 Tax=Alishewanella sp. SMS8 TaxID=2994676 RepID=UPI00274245FE|nr:hypothetical protein [Alishewanella sp. SMS8]MDP5460337.1 hypothetical protein [Alishewanella sp. SMS8]
MIKLSAAIIFSMLIMGCAKSSHNITGQVKPVIASSNVVVYDDAPQDYTEIATVSASSREYTVPYDPSGKEEVVDLLKSEAAALGANGVIITYLDNEGSTKKVATTSATNNGIVGLTTEDRFITKANGIAIFVK